MILTNGSHQSVKFQTFDWSREISPNLYIDRLLLLKVHKISAKKVQRSYVSWHWRMMQSLQKSWFTVSKMTRIRWTLTWAHESLSLKIVHFDWFLLCKVYNAWPKKLKLTWKIWQSLSWVLKRLNNLNFNGLM